MLCQLPKIQQEQTASAWGSTIPNSFFLSNNSEMVHWAMRYMINGHLIGGRTSTAHDQMTAQQQHTRESGWQSDIPIDLFANGNWPVRIAYPANGTDEQNPGQLLRNLIRPFLPSSGPNGTYPADTEYNHISTGDLPLRSDFSKSCSASLPFEEKGSKCVSIQETVWGSELKAKLEAIKKKVDPKNTFRCYACIGDDVEPRQ